jgi:hypothetical protein
MKNKITIYPANDIQENPMSDIGGNLKFIQMRKGDTTHLEYIKGIEGGKIKWKNPKIQKMYENKQIFVCEFYSHSLDVWSLLGEGPQCRFDTVSFAGLLIWKGDVYKYAGAGTDRESTARELLDAYNAYANGDLT